jgi:hypothetical protein
VIPTGNGEQRGPEAAEPMGTPLPGSRPSRAVANNARNRDDLSWAPPVVMEQGGFGKEDMECDPGYLGTEELRPSDQCDVPDLAAMGDGGQTFGGV